MTEGQPEQEGLLGPSGSDRHSPVKAAASSRGLARASTPSPRKM